MGRRTYSSQRRVQPQSSYMSKKDMETAMNVAIIGAGSAGMAMAKQILDVNARFNINVRFTLFERRAEVGGIWQYDEDVQDGHLAWEQKDGTLLPANTQTKRPLPLRYTWKGKFAPGPMFEGLRTNIPCDLMSYRDEVFPKEADLFPARKDVQSYLEAYATRYNLRQYVRFNTVVTRVVKDTSANDMNINSQADKGWMVHSKNIYAKDENGNEHRVEHYTHLVLAHGRCSTPNIPSINGLETFTGRVMHSQWYRDPVRLFTSKSEQKDKGNQPTVLVVGNGSSGMDIARELSGQITRTLPCGMTPERWKEECSVRPIKVFSSWNSRDRAPQFDYDPRDDESPEWSKRINVVDRIAHVDDSVIHLCDGTTLSNVDVIIFATGYLFDCPFVDQSTQPFLRYPILPPYAAVSKSKESASDEHENIRDNSHTCQRVGRPSSTMYNLDDWLLMHAHDESLAMLQLPIRVVPFPLTEVQAFYVINRWLGMACKLPALDTQSFDVDDERRWTSRRTLHDKHGDVVKDNGQNTPFEDVCDSHDIVLNPMSHVFGRVSEHAYMNCLLSFVRLQNENQSLKNLSQDSSAYTSAGLQVPWKDEYHSDGKGAGSPRGPEALFAVSPWRIERRSNGRDLRRHLLGY